MMVGFGCHCDAQCWGPNVGALMAIISKPEKFDFYSGSQKRFLIKIRSDHTHKKPAKIVEVE